MHAYIRSISKINKVHNTLLANNENSLTEIEICVLTIKSLFEKFYATIVGAFAFLTCKMNARETGI